MNICMKRDCKKEATRQLIFPITKMAIDFCDDHWRSEDNKKRAEEIEQSVKEFFHEDIKIEYKERSE